MDQRGDVLPWALLAWGFEFRGQRVPLVSHQGIFKPQALELPLSIRTSASGHYDDVFGADGLLEYVVPAAEVNGFGDGGRRDSGLARCGRKLRHARDGGLGFGSS